MSLDKKLQKSYEHGFTVGCTVTHENWMRALNETKGIGLIRKAQIIQTMERICREKVNSNGEDHQT